MSRLDDLLKAFGEQGGDRGILAHKEVAHFMAEEHNILSVHEVEGLELKAKETPTGIDGQVTVKEGTKIENPVHLCFGILHPQGSQEIKMHIRMEKDSKAHFIAHCIFPGAESVRHVMDALIEVGEGAEMHYSESHFHGPYGGIEVIPRAVIKVENEGKYFSDFNLVTGRVGQLEIDYTVDTGENSVAELTARVFGHKKDQIKIKDKAVLSGENARGLIKTRVAIEDEATAEVTGITEGNAKGARGHVDCMEIVKDHALAKAIPIVNVTHPQAKVTHEAAIGSVDKRQMETLMAHGLSSEEAVDLIVKGILK